VTNDGTDLRGLGTEQVRSGLDDLDLLSVDQLVSIMCADVQRAPEAVLAAEEQIARAAAGVAAALRRGGRLIYAGAGTAGRLGLIDAAEAGPTFNAAPGQVVGVLAGGRGAFDVPVENAEDDPESGAAAMRGLGVGPADAVVGITASGRTPYVLGAVRSAREAGAFTVALVCNEGAPLSALAEVVIEAVVGPEIVAGSTRLNSGTAQKIVLNIISTAAMVQLGKTYGGLMVDLRATNGKLRARAVRIVSEIAGVSADRARAALEGCGWRPKSAAAMLVGGLDAETAERLLERHGGRLRSALEEVGSPSPRAPGPGPDSRRLGVAGAFVDGTLVQGDVAISDGRVAAVGLPGRGEGLVVPALVDAQVNGYAGIDILSADAEALVELGDALLRDGVRWYQPTLITSSEDDLVSALETVASVVAREGERAGIVGVHLEGPFISPARAGAHPREHIRAPDPVLLERLLAAGPVRTVTLAPELPGALGLVRLCAARSVAVWLGHSNARVAEALAGFEAGAVAVTHLFNAMAPLTAREPGLAGTALMSSGVALQLIADGVHVSDELVRLAFASAPDRCSLVSDAIAAAGLGDGNYPLGGVEVEVEGGIARSADGVLAGGATPLAAALVRLSALGIPAAQAIAAATEHPARLLGNASIGRLEPGGAADVLVVDERLAVRQVFARGVRLDEALR
jgi:N-acetylglucosamine-6-phosphate deacetylase